MAGAERDAYLAELARRLRQALGENLTGVYLMGSAAMGADVPGASDLDVWALVAGPVPRSAKGAVVAGAGQEALPVRPAGSSWWWPAFRPGRSRSWS